MCKNKVVSHIFSNLRHMAEILLHRSVVIAILTSIISPLKVVVPGGAITISIRFSAMVDHLLHPLLFSIMRAIKAVYTVLSDEINAISDMFALTIQDIGQVEREESLIATHDE